MDIVGIVGIVDVVDVVDVVDAVNVVDVVDVDDVVDVVDVVGTNGRRAIDAAGTSPFEFLKIYLLSKKKIRLEKNGMFAFNGTDKNMNACNFYATYFAELALHSTLVFKPSIVAAACLSLAH